VRDLNPRALRLREVRIQVQANLMLDSFNFMSNFRLMLYYRL
jgi:hypothetical protein